MSTSKEYDLDYEIEGRAYPSSSESNSFLKDPTIIGIGLVGLGIAGALFITVNQPPPPPPVVQSIASVLEEWSVEHPASELIETRDFIIYDSYVAGLSEDEAFKETETFEGSPEEVMIRVITHDGSERNQTDVIGFTVCAYKTDGLTLEEHEKGQKEIFSFDSATGEVVQTNLEECLAAE